MLCCECAVELIKPRIFPNGKVYCTACNRVFFKALRDVSSSEKVQARDVSSSEKVQAIEKRSGFTPKQQLENLIKGLNSKE